MDSEDVVPRVSCRLELSFRSAAEAERVHRSVALDNEMYISSWLEKDKILAEIGAGSIKSLLHTLDDFLSCVSVAERIVTKGA